MTTKEDELEFVLKRILEEAEITTVKEVECEQCDKTIKPDDKCFRIGHSYFCSRECVRGD